MFPPWSLLLHTEPTKYFVVQGDFRNPEFHSVHLMSGLVNLSHQLNWNLECKKADKAIFLGVAVSVSPQETGEWLGGLSWGIYLQRDRAAVNQSETQNKIGSRRVLFPAPPRPQLGRSSYAFGYSASWVCSLGLQIDISPGQGPQGKGQRTLQVLGM